LIKKKYQRVPALGPISNGSWFLDDLAASFFRVVQEVYFVSRKE